MELKFDTLLVDLAERSKMGRGRAPCCEKVGLKKGPWAPAEDMRLVAYINSYGHENWRALPKQAGLLRCGKSCRLRWINYLRPDIKRGNFTQEEEEAIIKLHATLGNKWSRIAACLPGRTDNEIKNVWNTHLKKRLASKQFSPSIGESKESSHSSSPISSISDSNQGSGGIEEHEDMKIEPEHPPADPLEEITKIPIEPNMDLRDILDDTDTDAINKYTASKEELSVSKGPNLSTDESKELSSPASSICSSYTTWTNLIDGNSQKEVTHPLSVTRSPNDDYDMVHKEIMQDPYWKEILEIPIGPETEFWDVLEDDLCLYSSSGGDVDEQKANQNTDPKGETTGEVDNRWIRQLENELELWMTDDDHHQNIVNSASEPLVPFSANDESVEVEFDPIIKYFQTRHLSVPTCGL